MTSSVQSQQIVGTLQKPGLRPYSVAVYEAQDKVFVADESTGKLIVYDGTSLSELDSLFVGTVLWAMVIDQETGKLYVGCQPKGFERRIAVVDAKTNQFLKYLEGDGFTDYGNLFQGNLQVDGQLGKVYALHLGGLTQIDIATDEETKVPGYGGGQFEALGVNPITHEVFVTRYIENVLGVIQGASLQQTKIPNLGAAGLGVNWTENKVYLARGGGVGVPFKVYDRDTGQVTNVFADNDALVWLFNPGSNRMYTDSEVNAISTVIRGHDNSFFDFDVPQATTALNVRLATNRIYFAGKQFVGIYDEAQNQFRQIPVDNPFPSSIIEQWVAVNEMTGRVFIVHDREKPFVTVVQDSDSPSVAAVGGQAIAVLAGMLLCLVILWSPLHRPRRRVAPGPCLARPG